MSAAALPKLGRLVISRRLGESVRIGADVIVKVSRMHRAEVRLEIIAPKDVAITRTELEQEP